MKYLNRELKGTFGYIRKQTVFEIIKTIILFAMAVGLFMIGYVTLGTRRSLWSVFAVLSLLPASKSLVGVIMLLRYRSLTESEYEKISSVIAGIPAIYENILTTESKAYYVPVICCMASTVIAYYPGQKGSTDELKQHLENVMSNAGHKASVRIFDDEDDFLDRASEMKEKLSSDKDAVSYSILATIKAVSL